MHVISNSLNLDNKDNASLLSLVMGVVGASYGNDNWRPSSWQPIVFNMSSVSGCSKIIHQPTRCVFWQYVIFKISVVFFTQMWPTWFGRILGENIEIFCLFHAFSLECPKHDPSCSLEVSLYKICKTQAEVCEHKRAL